MGTITKIIVVVLIVALLVIPIIPSESCSTTTTNKEILGYKVGSQSQTSCNPSSTSILSIFLKGLKNT